MKRVYSIIKVIFKMLIFGFYYYWIFKALIFYLFPQNKYNISNGACTNGWMMIGYPIIIIFLTILYLLIILIYAKVFKTKDVNLYIKLIVYPIILSGILFWTVVLIFK